MIIENEIIDELCARDLINNGIVQISKSVIKKLDLGFTSFSNKIVVRNCIIEDLQLHSSWFEAGMVFCNNQVFSYIDHQMGGHNQAPIHITENIFHEFFNFFDCQFGEVIEVGSNIFLKGCNLLGNTTEGFKNVFEKGYKFENNLGRIDMDGVGFD